MPAYTNAMNDERDKRMTTKYQHDVIALCLCFNCVSARYVEGVHCGSCMAVEIQVESTEQCLDCYLKYAQENRVRQ